MPVPAGKICRVDGCDSLNLPGRAPPRFHNRLIRLSFPFGTRPAMALASRQLGRAGGETEGATAWECGRPVRLGSLPMSLENLALVKLSRQIALHRELEVVANNIANINTTGYKADGSVFHEFLMPLARDGSFQGRDQRLSYVHDRATWHNFSSGPIRQTGNPLDVSIDGDAFMVVQTPRGERYTRNGSLQLNATGQLVTQSGDPVLGDGGPIQFQSTDSNISINPDGTITVREA